MEGKPAKDTKMIAQERRQHIFEDIETSGIASVRDLAQRFEVSTITIMRDLQELEQEGLIRRVHGGAISVRGASYILDVGTTTLEIARALKGKRNLTVLVTNLRAALELASQAAIQVIVIGGKLRASELSLVGHLAEQTLRSFQVDKAFIGVGGITIEHGLTEFNFEEAGTKRTMIERARQRIVVADHTKFGKVMLTTVASLAVVDTIITGKEVDGEIVTRLHQVGVKVVLA